MRIVREVCRYAKDAVTRSRTRDGQSGDDEAPKPKLTASVQKGTNHNIGGDRVNA